jgi:transposase
VGCWRIRGFVLPQPVAQLRRHLPALLEDDGNELTISTRHLFHSLYEELIELETKITSADQRIERAFQENAECQRIAAVEGIGLPVYQSLYLVPSSPVPSDLV